MNMNRIILAAVVSACGLELQAQTRLELFAFGSGGGISSVPPISVYSTAGQSLVGAMSGENVDLQIGFGSFVYAPGMQTGVEDLPEIPVSFSLSQNYPNPFNPSTTIRFDIPRRAGVTLVLYDILGQRVATLVDQEKGPGRYEAVWNGRNDAGQNVSSGVYIYRLKADDRVQSRKLMLVK